MCTLAIFLHCSERYPVVVAANRDEFYERPATPPDVLQPEPWIFGGRDLVAGGTWLGVNARHVVAGLLNRRTSLALDPQRRSRGHLCVDALNRPSATEATAFAMREPWDRYNPFNLLVADPDAAMVIGNASGSMHCTRLTPGVHVLTNLELNDMECPRVAKSYGMFLDSADLVRRDDPGPLLLRLREILSDHSTPLDPRAPLPPNNLCVHTDRYGTRSSSILIYDRPAARFRLWHADGPPCVTAYLPVELPEPQALLDKRRASR